MDSPNDIDSMVTLTIHAVSKRASSSMFANGRNQVPIEIKAKAVNKHNRVLHFSRDTWTQILNLRFAESDEKLSRDGKSGWCFTSTENEFSREIGMNSMSSNIWMQLHADDSITVIMYVYTTSINTKRIAVSVDLANGKHITTADNAAGAETMSVTIVSNSEKVYNTKDLLVAKAPNLNPKKKVLAVVLHEKVNGYGVGKTYKYNVNFECHYDNYYVNIPYGIERCEVHGYGDEEQNKWICNYDSEHDNQHMIVAHRFRDENGHEESDEFGFTNTKSFALDTSYSTRFYTDTFDLTQNVTFNEHSRQVCFTQMTFETGADGVWIIPDNVGLDKPPFSFDTWFELFDIYGNHGKFSVGFTDDHKSIKFSNR